MDWYKLKRGQIAIVYHGSITNRRGARSGTRTGPKREAEIQPKENHDFELTAEAVVTKYHIV